MDLCFRMEGMGLGDGESVKANIMFKNILIIRTDRIGDVILTTPSIKALRQGFPKARISILVAKPMDELVRGNPDLDDILIDDRQKEHKGIRGFGKLVSKIRAKKFDAAVIFHTKRRANLLCFLAGIPVRVGYKNDKFGFLLNHPVEDRRHWGEQHESQYCLDLVKHLGAGEVPLENLYVSIQNESERWAEHYFKEQDLKSHDLVFAFHLGASDPSKCWPAQDFGRLMERLIEKYSCAVILVGSSEMAGASLAAASKLQGKVLDLTGKTSLSQLVSVIKRCHLLVSNDSGPVHIAAAVKTPVVSIFTRNQPGINPQRWRPLGKFSKYVTVAPEQEMSFKKAGPVDQRYLEQIAPQTVFDAIQTIL